MAFVLVFSSFPVETVQAQQAPLFNMTMIAPTTNPARRQWAAIIADSYQTVGINAKVVYVSFGALDDRIWPSNCPCGQLYDQGGYDGVFIGWSAGVIPDIGSVTNYRDAGPNDVPNIGNNYAFFNNATVTNLIQTYSHTLDPNTRTSIAKQIFAMVQQQRPYLVILDNANVFAFKSYIYPWNQQSVYAEQSEADFEHWKLTQGNTINVALSADVNAIDPLPNAPSNTVYDLWIYGSPMGMEGGGAVYLDPRDFLYHNGIANSITSSPNGLNWTVNIRSGVTFQDSASVTSNDFVYTYMAQLLNDAGYVGLGTNQLYFGLGSKFTFLNGTSRYIWNGTLYKSASALPAAYNQTSSFTALNQTEFQFTLPGFYAFTNPGLMITGVLPMHILDSIPVSNWASSWFSTLQNTPTTYTWNKAVYGGNGSFAYGYGVIGDGPYIYRGYDLTTRTATFIKNNNYWNKTGLEALGEFNANTIHITVISGAKDAALAAFGNNQVNFLDDNYVFIPQDYSTIESAGGVHPVTTPPGGLWQELGLNLNSPVWGTGTATPAGQANPANAAKAALYVREALSYLIPRSYIIQTLQPTAKPGMVEYMDGFPAFYAPGAAPDPYNPTMAKSFLAAAGYQTGVAPPSTGGSFTLPTTTITIPGSTVVVPNFLLGNSITLSGSYALDPTKAPTWNGIAVTLDQSTDSGATWTPVLFTLTNTGGYYTMTYTPTVTGTVWYRTFLTGLTSATITSNLAHDPATVESLAIGSLAGRKANVTDFSYSAITKLQIGTLGDVVKLLASGAQLNATTSKITAAINALSSSTQNSLNTLGSNSATKTDISTLTGTVDSINTSVNNLNSQLSTLSYIAYAALAIAVILGLIAIALSMRKRS